MKRCQWADGHPMLETYHDHVWGVPCYDDLELFKKLILDGMQAGLSWLIVLKKQKDIEEAFDHFDINRILTYDQDKIDALMNNPKIIRNRLKIQSVITNARAYLKIKAQYGSFSDYLWSFVDFKPIDNQIKHMREIPTRNELSDRISKDLKSHGFKFVGTTIVYAFLQAVGIINDHETSCFRYEAIKKSPAR